MIWKIGIAIILVGLVAGGGYLYYQTTVVQKPGGPAIVKEEVTPAVEEVTPTPTPEEVDPAEYDIEVQNGSGTAGVAGTAQAFLDEEGFTVVSTANAENYDYTDTVIYAGDTVSEAWLSKLSEALQKKYEVQSRVETLDMETDADVVVVVGKSILEEVSASDSEATEEAQ